MKRIHLKKKKKVNIYLIPNFRNTGGKFYTIFTNVGERLDLSSIESYEEAVNGKIKCRKSVKINVGFPTFFINDTITIEVIVSNESKL